MTIRPSACLFVIAVATVSCSGNGTSVKKSVSISDDKMRVKVSAVVNGKKTADYDQTFDVADMTKEQRDSIVQHVSDSLNLSEEKK